MHLKVINSNSTGNCYILENDQVALIIEAGVRFEKIKKALSFNLRKVAGAIVTHDHKDHSESMFDLMKAGIDVWASKGTHEKMMTAYHHRSRVPTIGKPFKVGAFTVQAFDVNHDAAEPLGYLIHHADCGLCLFLTDTYYSDYTFKGLNHLIIEANYCDQIVKRKFDAAELEKFRRDRLYTSHMSLSTCKKTLAANDLSRVRNIVLIHLSDSNSDSRRFKREVEEETGKIVTIAEPDVVVDFNLKPF